MLFEELRRLAPGGNSTAFDYDVTWPSVPTPDISRSSIVLLAVTMGFGLMAVYGDTVVPGVGGRTIGIIGILGVIIVSPSLVGRGVRHAFFSPDRDTDRSRR